MAKKKFRVYGIVSGSKFLGVFEAETEQEAKDLGAESENTHISLCHQCSNECDDAQIHEYQADEVK